MIDSSAALAERICKQVTQPGFLELLLQMMLNDQLSAVRLLNWTRLQRYTVANFLLSGVVEWQPTAESFSTLLARLTPGNTCEPQSHAALHLLFLIGIPTRSCLVK